MTINIERVKRYSLIFLINILTFVLYEIAILKGLSLPLLDPAWILIMAAFSVLGYFTEAKINPLKDYVYILILYLIFMLLYYKILCYFALEYSIANMSFLFAAINPIYGYGRKYTILNFIRGKQD